MAIGEAVKGLWLIGAGGEVRVGDEAALAREVKRALGGEGLSRGFMAACADLFFEVLGDGYAFVPEGGLARVMGAAARIRVLAVLAHEVVVSVEGGGEMREVGVASAWLAGVLTRSVGSLVERARLVGSAPVPGVVASAWVVGGVLAGQYVRAAERVEAGGFVCGGGVGCAGV